MVLCPNHHRQFDRNALTSQDIAVITESMNMLGYDVTSTILRKEG